MTALIILFAAMSLQLAPANTCKAVYERTEMLRRKMMREIRAAGRPAPGTLKQSAMQSRRARRCYGAQQTDTVATLYQRELYALKNLHQYDKALAVADSFLAQFRNSGRPGQEAYVLDLQGQLYAALSNIDKALASYAASVATARKGNLPVGRRTKLYAREANLYQQIGDYEAAQRRYQRAEAELEAAAMTNSENVRARAYLLRKQSDLIIQQADFQSTPQREKLKTATKKASQAARLYRRAGIPQSAGVAYITAAEAKAYAGHEDAALRIMKKARRLGKATGNLLLRYQSAYKLGRLRLQRQEYDRAEPLFDRALNGAQQHGDLDYQRRISIDQGLLHEIQDEGDKALKWYRRAARLTERYRATLGVTEWAAQASGNWYWQQPYRGQVRILLHQGKPRAAFRLLEQSRSRYLRTLRRYTRRAHTLPSSRRARFDSLRQALAATRDSLARTSRREHARFSLQARETRLMVSLDTSVALTPDTSSFSVETIQRRLAPRRRVLLSYFLDSKKGIYNRRPQSYLFVLTPDTLQAVAINATTDSVRKMMSALSPALAGRAPHSTNDVHVNLSGLHRLYQSLYAPASSLIPRGAPLIVIPDGPLYGLPFGSLVTRTSANFDYRHAPYLLRHHAVASEASAAMLNLTPPRNRKKPYDVVAFGKSDFTPDAASGGAPLRSTTLSDLPAVPRELEALRGLFASVFTARGQKATEAAFYEHMSEGRILHLASHTVVSTTSSLYNAIVLSKEKNNREDGILHLYELQRHFLQIPLVVLSGCNTARGPMRRGEGMESLEYGFRTMGAESLLATLWLVEDQAITHLMRNFYHHLRDGQPKDEALRQAQLTYLRQADARRTSPFFWASPVLYGQTRPLALTPRRDSFTGKWTIGGLLLALALGLLWWRYRQAA